MMINYYSSSLASLLSGHIATSQIVIIIECLLKDMVLVPDNIRKRTEWIFLRKQTDILKHMLADDSHTR